MIETQCGRTLAGQGRYIYPDGDVYEGQWLDDKAHGEGFHQSKQSRYNGQWAMDLKHGYATEVVLGDDFDLLVSDRTTSGPLR